jgi:hypothetical protein
MPEVNQPVGFTFVYKREMYEYDEYCPMTIIYVT